MPIYAFRDERGRSVEAFFPVNQAPKIGDVVTIEGDPCTRVAHFHIDAGGIARKVHKYPFTSESLPRGIDFGCPRDAKGRQIITSQRAEAEVLARTENWCEGPFVRD